MTDASGEMMRGAPGALADPNSFTERPLARRRKSESDTIVQMSRERSQDPGQVFENRILGGDAISADERQRPH